MEIHSLSRQCVVDVKRIQRFYHFHIGIHIKTAMIMKLLQAGIVRDKSPFLRLIGFFAVRILRHIEVTFIPLDDFIIRAVCLSGSDVLLHLFSQRISAKPAVMYLLRNHCILSPLIYIFISIFKPLPAAYQKFLQPTKMPFPHLAPHICLICYPIRDRHDDGKIRPVEIAGITDPIHIRDPTSKVRNLRRTHHWISSHISFNLCPSNRPF